MTSSVFISRPMQDAQALAKALHSVSPTLECILSPALEIATIHALKEERDFDALLLTSRHAVPAAARMYPNAKAICVGDATAHCASEAGLETMSAGGTIEDLIEIILNLGISSYLHLHGAYTHGSLKERLQAENITMYSSIVYEQVACGLSDLVKQQISNQKSLLVPVYSPRSAQIVSHNLQAFEKPIILIAISQHAADFWHGSEPEHIIIAEQPNAVAMLGVILAQVHLMA